MIPKDLDPYLIGLWRFEQVEQPRLWCATFRYRGHYYDVPGCVTIDQVFIRVRGALSTLKKGHARGSYNIS